METIKVTIERVVQYEYEYNGKMELRDRDVEIYSQVIECEKFKDIVAAVAMLVNSDRD